MKNFIERIKNLKTTASGLVAAVVTIVAFFGFDLSIYEEVIIGVLGAIGTIVGLLARD